MIKRLLEMLLGIHPVSLTLSRSPRFIGLYLDVRVRPRVRAAGTRMRQKMMKSGVTTARLMSVPTRVMYASEEEESGRR